MTNPLPGRIQIAGVVDQEDADRIIASGADMMGFPLGLRDGREDLSVAEAAKIVSGTSGQITSVCITYLDTAAEVIALCNSLGVRWVQLHGRIDPSEAEKLRTAESGLGIIKSLIVRSESQGELLREVMVFEPIVDAFITDTFDPDTGRSGATGKTHDWAISRLLVQSTARPVILAGGLNPGNVREAIREVTPHAVDAHTGVEDHNGFKSLNMLKDFVGRALEAL